MTASDHSVFECGYFTLEVYMDPVFWGGVGTKFLPFPSAIFPVRERGRTGKVGNVLFVILHRIILSVDEEG